MTSLRSMFRLTSPADDRYVPVADGLRALCILGIMWYHIWQQSWLEPTIRIGTLALNLNWLVRCGYLLVDAMLMLSGFLLFLPYARAAMGGEEPDGVLRFYKKRAARILPAYFLSVLVMLLGVALPQGQYASLNELWRDLIPHLTLTQVFFHYSYTFTHLNVVLWTVSIEVQFYLLFPLLAKAFQKFPLPTYAAMVLTAFAYRELYAARQPDTTYLINQFPAMLDVYANGMLASYAYVSLARSLKENTATAMLFTLLSAAALMVIYLLFNGQLHENGYDNLRLGQMSRRYGLSLCFSLFLLGAAHGLRPVKWLLGNRLMRLISLISYEMYIWHHPLALQLKVWRFPPYASEVNPQFYNETVWQKQYTLVCFAFSILLALILTYGFERPVSRLILRRRATNDQAKGSV